MVEVQELAAADDHIVCCPACSLHGQPTTAAQHQLLLWQHLSPWQHLQGNLPQELQRHCEDYVPGKRPMGHA